MCSRMRWVATGLICNCAATSVKNITFADVFAQRNVHFHRPGAGEAQARDFRLSGSSADREGAQSVSGRSAIGNSYDAMKRPKLAERESLPFRRQLRLTFQSEGAGISRSARFA